MTRRALVLAALALGGCAFRTSPDRTGDAPPLRLVDSPGRVAVPEQEADAALDAGADGELGGPLDAELLDAELLDVPDHEAGAALDAGELLDATEPGPNPCGGAAPLVCSRPPCEPGATCATVTDCGNGNVCVDCPGTDVGCTACGGAWRWECASPNALRCTNGAFTC